MVDWTRVAGGPAPKPAEPPVKPKGFQHRTQTAEEKRGQRDRAQAARNKNLKESKAGRRLAHGQNPTTAEVEYEADELEFILAVEAYKRAKKRPFPTVREMLWVMKTLGYRKTAKPGATDGHPSDQPDVGAA